MLQFLDTTLSKLLTTELAPPVLPDVINVYFMTPDANFPGTLKLPAINLFLFSLLENRELRDTDRLRARMNDGSVASEAAPVRIDCHYLVTAYPKVEDPTLASADEHWIIGEAMRALLRYPEIPAEYITDPSLIVQGLPLLTETALPTQRHQMGTDLWQALGHRPRAAFHYKVTTCFATDTTNASDPAATRLRLGDGS